jgi:hypothetical protein
MAKRKQELDALDEIFAGPPHPKKADARNVKNVGVSLDLETLDAYAALAKEQSVSRNALMRHALVKWLELHRAGDVEPVFETARKLKV